MTSPIRALTDADERSELNAPDEPPARRQPGEVFEYTLDESGADWQTVRITNRERIHYERTAAKREWPRPDVAPSLTMTFCIWSAAQRAGLTAFNFEQFEKAMLDWNKVEDVPADPSRRTVSPDVT
jgi:hypothetical protein